MQSKFLRGQLYLICKPNTLKYNSYIILSPRRITRVLMFPRVDILLYPTSDKFASANVYSILGQHICYSPDMDPYRVVDARASNQYRVDAELSPLAKHQYP
jgi:hypothetical protein